MSESYYDCDSQREGFGKGRVCTWDGCETVLSIYNNSDRCRKHPRHKILVKPANKSGKRRR